MKATVELSVSSNGSLGLKLGRQWGRRGRHSAFSILERIVGVETCGDCLEVMPQLELSVSSNGSLGLKPGLIRAQTMALTVFQYPRTDRWG